MIKILYTFGIKFSKNKLTMLFLKSSKNENRILYHSVICSKISFIHNTTDMKRKQIWLTSLLREIPLETNTKKALAGKRKKWDKGHLCRKR